MMRLHVNYIVKILLFATCYLIISVGCFEHAMAEGLSQVAKTVIINKTNPEIRSFIRDYLDSSDRYSKKECIKFADMAGRSQDDILNYCDKFFNDTKGLSNYSAYSLRNMAGTLKYSHDLKLVLYKYLMESKQYSVQGCHQAWATWVDAHSREHELGRKKRYEEAEDMCMAFFDK